ncbi:prepilin-type N-terminal cleavage/methylation domain-containing protein, partial [Campylobacter coli]|nr:prepilin-type N-terminal cleavage/methylation domain-containing protein [Campylobacter coli]
MKVAFSLLELILCIIILGLIFTSTSKLFYQLNDNH